jgi:hypothetical protein
MERASTLGLSGIGRQKGEAQGHFPLRKLSGIRPVDFHRILGPLTSQIHRHCLLIVS